MTPVTVETAEPDDAAGCAAIVNDWIDRTDWMPRIHTRAAVVDYYRRHVLPKRLAKVARRGTFGTVSGFLALEEEAGLITDLYCAQPGRGIGRRLLEAARTQADALRLWTFVANEGARRFYAREGFKEVRRTDGDNDERLPDVLLTWERAA
ncbi:L-amino acid N-acyltransferase YncA [Roseivivax lentus]|uniref:L-amino acid N-acyltransferase YncA n=1 Tax=Roseivivax lentus TaxID=633194 RepID=A0A1N7LR33_9RHOB|nr:GNAT family N-acetyltransferase [Roseivivax lentus]SIS76313.1 L-amino acid N-acyltransferase YncA [Roseivivax lentus]